MHFANCDGIMEKRENKGCGLEVVISDQPIKAYSRLYDSSEAVIPPHNILRKEGYQPITPAVNFDWDRLAY